VLDQLLLVVVDEHSHFLVVVVAVVVAVTTHRSPIRLEEELAAAGSQIRLRCPPSLLLRLIGVEARWMDGCFCWCV
jgi:hypothetical protein